MLELETCIQQGIKVALPRLSINDLAEGLPALGRELAREVGARMLDEVQARCFAEVSSGAAEVVCTRCGVVHRGPGTLLRRGRRMRRLKTSSGSLVFRLHQVTCGACGRTWSPFADALGLAPRQRFSEELERKLVECVTELSYAKSCALGAAWLGESLSPRTLHRKVQERGAAVVFTPAPECAVVEADGTMVPAGKNPRGCDVWFSLQILGREEVAGRTRVKKRIGGWAMGSRGWEGALPSGVANELILTDREKGVPEFLQKAHPEVRHGLCEWHLSHTLDHLLLLDGVKVERRKTDVAQLSRILSGPMEERAEAYTAFTEGLTHGPRAQRMLRSSAAQVLYDAPPPERTTSVIEREMREINRRADVGVRWTVPGIDHLLRLRHARRINPDDFERVWSDVQMPSFTRVSLL
ncbi:MAG TPA: hypothetical protein VE913_04630 [Longimicrobium sp.]|nr:hypothetical protein [Longimicrobium sp.]